jgi:hypothetical protein
MEKIESGPAYMAGHASAADYHIGRSEKQASLDAQTREAFSEACRKADANALATWAPTVSDIEGGQHARRAPAFHEVLLESLDFTHGPSMSELMQLLLNTAYGTDLAEAREQARCLLERMGAEWVKHCGPEVEA